MSLEITQLFIGIVLLAFAWVALDYFFEHFWGRIYRWISRRQYRDCHLCGKIYLEKSKVKLSHCPDCDGLNSQKSHHRLG